MRYTRRSLAAAALALAVAAAPADAGELLVVGGGRAERVNDPALPERAVLDLPMPQAVASTAIATASRGREWRTAAAASRRGRRAVLRALRRSEDARAGAWRRSYLSSLRELRRLRGARDTQLRYVVDSVEALAVSRRLTASRMPASFLQLERNRQYWRRYPFPASRDQVSFRGSQIVFTYFPGEGLQLHPLTTFKKANALHGFCEREEPGCDRAALKDLLDEMTGLAVRRSRRFIAWEYMFHFGGGSPPWMSGMAQATALQAYARAAKLLDKPEYVQTARKGLGAFETRSPTGVRTTGPGGGVHYLQYSFSPRLFIFNAFLQSLIGLHDFGRLTGNARATELFREAEPEARAEVPLSDVGDWSRYSYAGAESTRDYHELLREFLQSMCTRRLGRLYCEYARRYRGYQVDPPELKLLGPSTASAHKPVAVRFSVSKLSAVELKIYRGGRLVHDALATFRLGNHSFTWTPRAPGAVRVELAAKELRTGLGKRDRASGEIEIDP